MRLLPAKPVAVSQAPPGCPCCCHVAGSHTQDADAQHPGSAPHRTTAVRKHTTRPVNHRQRIHVAGSQSHCCVHPSAASHTVLLQGQLQVCGRPQPPATKPNSRKHVCQPLLPSRTGTITPTHHAGHIPRLPHTDATTALPARLLYFLPNTPSSAVFRPKGNPKFWPNT